MQHFLRKYGVETILNFYLFEADGVNFRVDAVDGGSDCNIRKDQGADATCVNDFVDEGIGYSLTVTATEMEGAELTLPIIDSVTKVWLDEILKVETYGHASAMHSLDLDDADGSTFTETGGDGAQLTEAGGDGDHLTAINLPNQTMDITGSLSGSVGSVTTKTGYSLSVAGILAIWHQAVSAIVTAGSIGLVLKTAFAGLTSLAEWLGLIAGKQTANATAKSEIQATGAGSGTFDEATDSLEGMRDTALPVALIGGRIDADMGAVSGDVSAADNMELMYDGTGYVDDTAPAARAQLDQLASVGSAIHTPAASYVLTTGTQSSGTVTSTEALDGTEHQHTDVGGIMDLYYQFDVGSDGVPVGVHVTGRINGNNDDLDGIFAWNWGSSSWDQIGAFAGQASSVNVVRDYDLFTSHVGTGANLGLVRIRFSAASGLTTATLSIDQIFCSYAVVARSVGYADGAIWINTGASNTNTVPFFDGTADNPVSTWAAALTLSASLGIIRFHIINGSTIALSANSDNYTLVGDAWTLDLNGQSIVGAHFTGADVFGIGLGVPHDFRDCELSSGGTLTVAGGEFHNCGLDGSIVLTGAVTYDFDQCFSRKAGAAATPDIDFGAALGSTNLNLRHYSGGIEIKNMGTVVTDTMSLEGEGQLIINANCAAGTIAIRGEFTITDNAGGVLTISDDARIDVDQIGDAVADEPLTAAEHNITTSHGRRIREIQELNVYENRAVWIDTVNGSAGTSDYENGTVGNPVNSIADANTIAASIGLSRFEILPGSSITFAAAQNNQEFNGFAWTLALGGQQIVGSMIRGATVSGIAAGTGTTQIFTKCIMNATSHIKGTHLLGCGIAGTQTVVEAGNFFFDQCYSAIAGTGTWIFEFGDAIGATNLNMRHYSGGVQLESMGDTGTDTASIEGFGQIIEGTCTGGTVVVRGNFTVSGIANLALSDDARIDVAQINAEVDAALNTAIPGSPTANSINQKVANLPENIQKNVAFPNFHFKMVLTSDHSTAAPLLAVTAERLLDGGAAFVSMANSVVEVGLGWYRIDLAQADTNGDVITYRFSAALADVREITFNTAA